MIDIHASSEGNGHRDHIVEFVIDPHGHGDLRLPLEHRMNVQSIGRITELGFLGRWLLVIAGVIISSIVVIVIVIVVFKLVL